MPLKKTKLKLVKPPEEEPEVEVTLRAPRSFVYWLLGGGGLIVVIIQLSPYLANLDFSGFLKLEATVSTEAKE